MPLLLPRSRSSVAGWLSWLKAYIIVLYWKMVTEKRPQWHVFGLIFLVPSPAQFLSDRPATAAKRKKGKNANLLSRQ